MRNIHQKSSASGEETCVGQSYVDAENLFIDSLCNGIAMRITQDYYSQTVIRRLLIFSIKRECSDLLKQYLHCELDIISDMINRKFDIKEKVCYGHGTHAKLNNHIDKILEKRNASNSQKD